MRRLLLTPRWVGLTAVLVLLVVGFLVLGWWQARRALIDGNLRSFGYALEWPAFAVMVIIMYVKTLREEYRGTPVEADRPPTNRERKAAARRAATRLTATSARSLAATRPGSGDATRSADDEDDEELAAFNRRLAELNAGAARHAAGAGAPSGRTAGAAR